MLQLNPQDWQLINFMVRLGVATTIVSIPVGVWAMRRWPENQMVPVAMIGLVAVIVRSLMNGSYLQNNTQLRP